MLGGTLHDSQVFYFVIHLLAGNFGLYNLIHREFIFGTEGLILWIRI